MSDLGLAFLAGVVLGAVLCFVALLVTYPFGTLTWATILYLAMIPVSWRRYGQMLGQTAPPVAPAAPQEPAADSTRRIVAIRSAEPPR